MKILHTIAFILLAIAGLDWGLVGLGWLAGNKEWDVVHMILGMLGSSRTLEAAVYVLVGLSAVWLLVTHRGYCRACKA